MTLDYLIGGPSIGCNLEHVEAIREDNSQGEHADFTLISADASCVHVGAAEISSPSSSEFGFRIEDRGTRRHGGVTRSHVATAALSNTRVREIISAAQEAILMGLPLNAFITIDLELGGITDCVSATGEFLRHAKRWLRGRGVETAHVWVQEPGEVVGQHVHLLLHLAPTVRREFFRRHRGWLKRCGAKSAAGLVDSSAVGKSYEAALGDTLSRNDYLINLRHVIDYVVKEASTETHLAFGLRTPAKGGIVIGKRSSSSENINRAARARRGREYGPGSPWHIALADLSQCTDPSREPTESEHSPSRSEARGLPHG